MDDEAGFGGRELAVVRGEGGAPQKRRVPVNGWTGPRVKTFLEHLAATCNVRFSARVAGMSESGAYAKRRDDPMFREAWREAIESGYARLEAMLIARAGGTADTAALLAAYEGKGAASSEAAGAVDAIVFDPGANVEVTEALDSALAMSLMAAHRKVSQGGGTHGGGARPTAADPDALTESILKQLSALNKRRGGRG